MPRSIIPSIKIREEQARQNVERAKGIKLVADVSVNSPGPVDKNSPADASKKKPTYSVPYKYGTKTRLTKKEYLAAAKTLGIDDVAIVLAVARTESNPQLKGFLDDGRPLILYEPHRFHTLTAGKYSDKEEHKEISYSAWGTRKYGSYRQQHNYLTQAIELDEEASLKACSWGLFQVMGENHKLCGHDSVKAFVAGMCNSEQDHLDAFIAYCESVGCVDDMKNKRWKKVAEKYNGPSWETNKSKLDGTDMNYAERFKYWYDYFADPSVGWMATNKKADYEKITKLLINGRFLDGTAPAILEGGQCPTVVVDAIKRFTRVFLRKAQTRIEMDESAHKSLRKLIETPSISSVVGKGQQSARADILTVQNLLRRAGYLNTEEYPNVGAKTSSAIKKFQDDHKAKIGITSPTGNIGKKSMPVLISEAKKKDS